MFPFSERKRTSLKHTHTHVHTHARTQASKTYVCICSNFKNSLLEENVDADQNYTTCCMFHSQHDYHPVRTLKANHSKRLIWEDSTTTPRRDALGNHLGSHFP